MIINEQTLIGLAPIKAMKLIKIRSHGVTHGLSEAGYDIRIKQSVWFRPISNSIQLRNAEGGLESVANGRFTLASAMEEFQVPDNLTGIIHDKSTWARRGLSVFNTVIEPGWHGFLTLELVYHGQDELIIPAGAGIAQVVFHENKHPVSYTGRYQGQADCITAAIQA